MMRRAVLCAFALTLVSAQAANASFGPTTSVSISQVYGGGGTASAVYSNDFVELHNVSRTAQSLTGASLQYASATGTTWGVTQFPMGTSIPAGGYLLVAFASGATGAPLPAPDLSNAAVAMGSTAGKVALVDSTVALTCGGLITSCGVEPLIIDYVGYGSAYDYETHPTPALSAFLAAHRRDGGCTDTNDNSQDFTAAAPAPRNSATSGLCNNAPVFDALASPYTVAEGSPLTFTVTATDIEGDPVTISTQTAPSGTNAASYNASTHEFTWTPDSTRAAGSPYTVVFAAEDGLDETLTAVTINVTDVPAPGGESGTSTSGGQTTTSTETAAPGPGPAPTTPTAEQTPQPATTPSSCVVPKLKGSTLKQAKAKLRKARCALGKVKKKAGKRSARGKVLAQTKKPGARAPQGTKIGLTLGR